MYNQISHSRISMSIATNENRYQPMRIDINQWEYLSIYLSSNTGIGQGADHYFQVRMLGC